MNDQLLAPYIQEALSGIDFSGICKKWERYGSGHINDTFLLVMEDQQKERNYILQRMNGKIFKNPIGLMNNITGVTEYIREGIIKRGGDPDREVLQVIPTKKKESCFQDSAGNYWRGYLFIEDAVSYNQVEKPEHFYESGKAFGRFQGLLAGYPVEKLTETIPNFHNTPIRMQAFEKAVEEDSHQRADEVRKEIRFFMDRREEMSTATDLFYEGRLPARVTHNDTKLNNIMIDRKTGVGICVIDLDTIMPGLSIHDFGDAIRFGANTGAEDEKELSKISLSLPLFEVFTKGFLEGCQGNLTEEEIQMFPMGAKLMTMECGIRFLTDYLQGDSYFKIHHEGHNLDRARTQIALVVDMEKKWQEMQTIVAAYKG